MRGGASVVETLVIVLGAHRLAPRDLRVTRKIPGTEGTIGISPERSGRKPVHFERAVLTGT